jgi:hypothetical protein
VRSFSPASLSSDSTDKSLLDTNVAASRRNGRLVVLSQIIAAAFSANMATLPLLWFVYPELLDFWAAVALGEVTALIGEGLLYFFLLIVPLRLALQTSLVANGASVLAGLLIMPPF